MVYYARVTKEDGSEVAVIRFADGTEVATQADEGEDLRALLVEALELRLESYLEDGNVPPRSVRGRGGKALAVAVSPTLAARIALRVARQEAGLTQGELARRAHVSQQAVAKLEKRGANPSVETLEKLAKAMGRRVEVSFEQPAT